MKQKGEDKQMKNFWAMQTNPNMELTFYKCFWEITTQGRYKNTGDKIPYVNV